MPGVAGPGESERASEDELVGRDHALQGRHETGANADGGGDALVHVVGAIAVHDVVLQRVLVADDVDVKVFVVGAPRARSHSLPRREGRAGRQGGGEGRRQARRLPHQVGVSCDVGVVPFAPYEETM